MIFSVKKLAPYTSAQFHREKPNPGCGHKSGVFTSETMLFTGDGTVIMSGRIHGWCNDGYCDQRFYVYPASRRITRRNSGETLKQRHSRLGHY